MSPPTRTDPTPVLRHRRGSVLGVLLGTAASPAVLGVVAPMMRLPHQVPKLVVSNPTVYQMNVQVTGDPSSGWMDLGGVGRERTKTIEEVADQGERWVFRFSYGGVDAGQLVVERSALETAGWRITLPDGTTDRLRAAGLPPSAF